MSPAFYLGLGLLIGFGLGALFLAIVTCGRNGAQPAPWTHRPCRCADCVHIFGWPPIMPSDTPPPPRVGLEEKRRRGW